MEPGTLARAAEIKALTVSNANVNPCSESLQRALASGYVRVVGISCERRLTESDGGGQTWTFLLSMQGGGHVTSASFLGACALADRRPQQAKRVTCGCKGSVRVFRFTSYVTSYILVDDGSLRVSRSLFCASDSMGPVTHSSRRSRVIESVDIG